MTQLTAEQKMQFLTTLAKSGANISQINLGDGTQNFYLGKGQEKESDTAGDAQVMDEVTETCDAEVMNDAEVMDEAGVTNEAGTYPGVTDLQRDFLETALKIRSEVTGQRLQVLDMPVEWLMHTIHDLTKEWDPTDKNSVHRWKLLYEVLLRLKYFHIEQKHRYKDFVKAVVSYCFPGVPESYSNNISKSPLEQSFMNWSNEDKALYQSLKEALTFQP